MIRDKRTVAFVAIALIVGVALALAVALSQGGTRATAAGSYSQAAATGSTGSDYSTSSSEILAGDPAKKTPLLDQFTSKDPFIELDPPPAADAGGTGGTGDTGGTGGTGGAYLGAQVKVNGKSYSVSQGDKVPENHPAFSISAVSSGGVTFALIEGQFSDGSTTVTVNVGEAVKVVNKDSGTEYTLSVASVGGSSGTGSTQGHSLALLSVNEQDGVAVATIEVDGKTYTDKKVGDVISTSWGELEVLAINVDAQTASLMHGDQTIVLHAGQVVVK